MLPSPLPNPLAVFTASKVILVLRTAHPLPLAVGLGNTAAFRLRAIALSPTIAKITEVNFAAMQALILGFRIHRMAQKKSHRLCPRRAEATKKIPPAPPRRRQ